jgi:SAM-dependent methyltransferase
VEKYIISYTEMVNSFIKENNIKRVIDLGCGDFAVGSRLNVDGIQYVGIDIVDELVQRNQVVFGKDNISFESLDIISETLPAGDLCLIRQVFQHLSNVEILSVLNKLFQYRFVIITEHYPAPSLMITPNIDKPHGGDTRIVDNSAVYLDHDPFNITITKMMLEIEVNPLVARGEVIKSFLITNEP